MENNKENNMEKDILKKENQILGEIKKEEEKLEKVAANVWVINLIFALLIIGAIAGFAYWKVSSGVIFTDKSDIEGSVAALSPTQNGTLEQVFVNTGDTVTANEVVARVGNELIKTKTAGIVSNVENNIGKQVNSGEAVVSVIDPATLRLVAHIEEDKGLKDIAIGERADFTVDSFPGKKYQGIVDEISPTSRSGDIVFNISDKRQVQEFDVKVRFDTTAYPELQNGMSAKVSIYKQ